MNEMAEGEIRKFVIGALSAIGVSGADREAVTNAVTSMWLSDRQVAADEAVEAVHEETRDSWNGGEGT